MIVGWATQVVTGASFRAHVSPDSSKNLLPVELLEASPRPDPPSVTQEAAPSLPVIKDPLAGAAEQYQDVLTLSLARISTGRLGRPERIKGGEETKTDPYKGGSQWERHPVSEASDEEEDKEHDVQEFSDDEAGQEAPGPGSGQLNQILEIISALASSVALLKVQLDRERWLTQQSMRHGPPLRRAPTQACQSGTTGTRPQQAITFPTAPSPAFPTAPAQARGTPNFQPAPTLAPVQRTYDTMAGVAARSPDLSVPGFPIIFNLLEDGVNTTPPIAE